MPGVLREPTSRVRIQTQVMRIGRRPDNDIIVSDLGVSKQHAELRRSPAGRYSIIDVGSHNGTYVNDTRVNQQELNEGDIIAIGHATFRLAGGELIEYVDDGRSSG
jgi:pSer/pThr/pTyr-binding forkhead associated (FHA) protein